MVCIRFKNYRQRIARSYAKNVHPKELVQGDWVLSRMTDNKKELNRGKLDLNLEGPHKIREVKSKGAYRLADETGKEIPRNIIYLKKYYV